MKFEVCIHVVELLHGIDQVLVKHDLSLSFESPDHFNHVLQLVEVFHDTLELGEFIPQKFGVNEVRGDRLLSLRELLEPFEDLRGFLHLLLTRLIAFLLQTEQFDHPRVKLLYVLLAFFFVIFGEVEELDQLEGRAFDLELEYPHNLGRGYLILFQSS